MGTLLPFYASKSGLLTDSQRTGQRNQGLLVRNKASSFTVNDMGCELDGQRGQGNPILPNETYAPSQRQLA